MKGILTSENLEWQERAREVADKVVRPLAAHYDREQTYPWEIRDALVDAGLMGVWIPKEYGGAGAGVLNLCIVVEELSRACGGVGVLFAVNALGSFPIILGGTEEQKAHYLSEVASGQKLIAFCLSEKRAGSDAVSLLTRAVQDGDSYVVNGEKKWTTNGGAADYYTVFAVTDPESRSRRISALLAEKGMEGLTFPKVEDKMGIRCAPVVETHFHNCRIPAANLLGGRPGNGFRLAMQTLDKARPGVAAQAVGLAQGALDWALYYVTRRKQFGQTLASFQGLQHRLAEMATRVAAARQLVYAAAKAHDAGESDVGRISAQAKFFATDTAMEVTTHAVQLFGGYGYMRDYPIEKYMRDAKITQIYEGTNEVQRLVIARSLLKQANTLDHLGAFMPHEEQRVDPSVSNENANA